MKKVYVVMNKERRWEEYEFIIVSGVFSSRKKAIEHIMEKFKGLVFTYDGRTGEYIREQPEQELTLTMWIEEWSVD